MDPKDKYKELVERRSKLLKKIEKIKKGLGNPRGGWASSTELAESDYKVYLALLEDLDSEIKAIKG